MRKILGEKQRLLVGDYLNNISAGWFLLGVVTPVLTNAKFDIINLIRVIFSLIFSLIIIIFAIVTVKE